MDSLRKMTAVALYEALTLWRSWFFRIFAGAMVLLVAGLNAMILSVGQFPTWVFRAIPANVPYAAVLLVNVIQSVVAIILATDFMKRDRAMDTTDVVYIRSMTNTSYVVGKACGNLLVFICLNGVALLCAALFNFFSGDVPVRLMAYCYYEFLISLPTLVFCIGLTFCLMSIIRSQPLSLVALFGILGLAFFFLPGRLYSLFDFVALRTPLMFSDIAGFGSTGGIAVLRALYLLLGIALVLIAALRLKRLPQSAFVSGATLAGVILFGGVAVAAGIVYVQGNLRDQQVRGRMIEQHNRQFGVPCIAVLRDSLSIVHAGNAIRATARVAVENETGRPVQEYQFRLNPGLAIRDIRGSHPMNFRRSLDYVLVKPANPLAAGALDTIVFDYAGTIDESACYLDVPPEEQVGAGAVFFFRKQTRYAFINDRFVLLTPESLFYPQAGAGYSSDHPEANGTALAHFSVTVNADPALTVISQGEPASAAGGARSFAPSVPLPGVSVIIGAYEKRSLVVDSVDYSLLTFAHHGYFKPYFRDLLADSVASLIRGVKADFENRTKFNYPYSRFTIIEVPLQFTDFPRVWTSGHEAMQPEIALLPENGFSLSDADFKAIRLGNLNFSRGRDQEVMTPQEQQTMMFVRFVTSTFQRDNAGRRLMLRPVDRTASTAQLLQWLPPVSAANANLFVFPEYFSYVVNVHAPSCPVFSLALESYFKKRASGDAAGMMRMFSGGAATDERVNGALENSGFDQIRR
ncbi:MAG TPA: ABC transporter permease, partial [Chitinivibrionales bacterium]|nr:ABC transporter permease [Chitinivibrionales bacterium]